MNAEVDKFLKKAKLWQEEIKALRQILLETDLEEDMKWNLPCYTYHDSNVVIIQPFKAYLGLMFFKGALLKDAKSLLVENGPNSHATRRLEFSSVKDIARLKASVKTYVKEAIAIEKSGQKVEVKRKPQTVPEELTKFFAKNSRVKKAFEALTPGRQRAYLMHFSSAKQSATRISRIEKCVPDILKGLGMNGR